MVDAPRLRALLSRLLQRREELREYARGATDDFLADRRAIDASKYVLITAIEDLLSIANHVIASEGLRAPADYADAFRSLQEARLLDADLADRLAAMARFRNLLVHVYAEVDDRRVHGYMRDELEDIERFVSAILAAFPDLEA